MYLVQLRRGRLISNECLSCPALLLCRCHHLMYASVAPCTPISAVSARDIGAAAGQLLCFSRRHRRHPSAGEGSRAAARLQVPARQRQHPLRTCRRSSAATATSARLPAEERWCRRRRARRAPTVGGSGRHPALRHRPPTRRGRRLALHCRPPTRCRAAAQIAARVPPKPRPPPPPPHPGAPPTAGPSHRRSAAAPSTGAAASYPLGSHGRLLPARLSLAFSRAVVGEGAATGGGGGQGCRRPTRAPRRPARVHNLWTQFHHFHCLKSVSEFTNQGPQRPARTGKPFSAIQLPRSHWVLLPGCMFEICSLAGTSDYLGRDIVSIS
jgi:hypothetical protein